MLELVYRFQTKQGCPSFLFFERVARVFNCGKDGMDGAQFKKNVWCNTLQGLKTHFGSKMSKLCDIIILFSV